MAGTSPDPVREAANLDLWPIGNCAVSALIDAAGRYVWACVAARRRRAGVLRPAGRGSRRRSCGAGDLGDRDGRPGRGPPSLSAQHRRPAHRADRRRGLPRSRSSISPRAIAHSGRMYRPAAFVRLVRPLTGAPRIRIRLRPTADWGASPVGRTSGSNHVRYLCASTVLGSPPTPRSPTCSTSAPSGWRTRSACSWAPTSPSTARSSRHFTACATRPQAYWRDWVRTLSVPLDWQEAVIRAAITLKLCAYEETGAIVAALTTSIPEARRIRAATGTTATAGCATPTMWSRR